MEQKIESQQKKATCKRTQETQGKYRKQEEKRQLKGGEERTKTGGEETTQPCRSQTK